MLLASLLLVACGGDDKTKVDAPIHIDAPGGGSDGPGGQVTCAYTEMADATNNMAATAEASGLAVTGSTAICGKLDSSHFDSANQLVDVDVYGFSLAADQDLIVRVWGAAAALDTVTIQIADPSGTQLAFGKYLGDHGALSVHLTAGNYVAGVAAFNPSAIGSAIDYHVSFELDTPATRCGKITAAANYTETGDGGGSGNDMVDYNETADPQKRLTTSTTDMPEMTGVTATAGSKSRLTGSSANVNAADSYMDRDTYQFTTGANVNELSIRLNWAATTVDFDYLVLAANSANSFAGGLRTSNSEDEFETFAVAPSTTYWLWVGSYDGSTGLPQTYDASICAATVSGN